MELSEKLIGVALEQAERRPDPRLPVVDLVRNLFRDNPERVFYSSEVSAIIRSIRPDVNPKYVGSMLAKLCRFPNAFLANSGRGAYRLVKAERAKVMPTVGTVSLTEELEVFKKKATTRLSILRSQRAEMQAAIDEINEEIFELDKLF